MWRSLNCQDPCATAASCTCARARSGEPARAPAAATAPTDASTALRTPQGCRAVPRAYGRACASGCIPCSHEHEITRKETKRYGAGGWGRVWRMLPPLLLPQSHNACTPGHSQRAPCGRTTHRTPVERALEGRAAPRDGRPPAHAACAPLQCTQLHGSCKRAPLQGRPSDAGLASPPMPSQHPYAMRCTPSTCMFVHM